MFINILACQFFRAAEVVSRLEIINDKQIVTLRVETVC